MESTAVFGDSYAPRRKWVSYRVLKTLSSRCLARLPEQDRSVNSDAYAASRLNNFARGGLPSTSLPDRREPDQTRSIGSLEKFFRVIDESARARARARERASGVHARSLNNRDIHGAVLLSFVRVSPSPSPACFSREKGTEASQGLNYTRLMARRSGERAADHAPLVYLVPSARTGCRAHTFAMESQLFQRHAYAGTGPRSRDPFPLSEIGVRECVHLPCLLRAMRYALPWDNTRDYTACLVHVRARTFFLHRYFLGKETQRVHLVGN